MNACNHLQLQKYVLLLTLIHVYKIRFAIQLPFVLKVDGFILSFVWDIEWVGGVWEILTVLGL